MSDQATDEVQALDKFIDENRPLIAAEEAAASKDPAAKPALTLDEVPEIAVATEKEKEERLSTLQKINNMTVADRVKRAFLGNKEERLILIRDGSKVVSGAVLQSPKISEQEVEAIAAMKNVQESVLRDLARNRRFIKNYSVVKNLVNNPRTPLDLSMGLMKGLLVNDLKVLSMNKNVPETLKKMALRSYKEKSTPPGQKVSH